MILDSRIHQCMYVHTAERALQGSRNARVDIIDPIKWFGIQKKKKPYLYLPWFYPRERRL